MKKILIIGACSAIAQETAKCFAKEGADLYLVDLKTERLEAVRLDIIARTPGANLKIEIDTLDVNEFDKHKINFYRAADKLNGIDSVLIAHGTLADQAVSQNNSELIIKEFNTNCVSVISLASIAANYFEERKTGTIAVISSVAGDRGRQSNYIYGSAKGGVSIFLQGLRNRLSGSGVKVITIKPGMVDTPMTAQMPKGVLFSSAETVGKGIYEAMTKGKDIAYIPGYWRLIMFVIKHIPESIFKKLHL